MQDSPETIAILRRMAEVRADLDDGAQEIAEGARDLGQWQHYVKSYPWVCLTLAGVIGYVLVPRRRMRIGNADEVLAELLEQTRLLPKTRKPSSVGVFGALRAVAGNMLWRSALSYAVRQATQYFAKNSITSTPEEDS